jgi:hypothetical protein
VKNQALGPPCYRASISMPILVGTDCPNLSSAMDVCLKGKKWSIKTWYLSLAACQNLLAEFHGIHTSHVRRPIKTDSIPMGASTLASRFVQKSPQMLIFNYIISCINNNPFLIPFLTNSFKKKIARYCSILFHWKYIKKNIFKIIPKNLLYNTI